MSTGFNPQFQPPYPMQGQYYAPALPANPQIQPRTSVGAVEINIINPTATAGGQTNPVQPQMQPYAPYIPQMNYPQGSVYGAPYNMQMANYPMNYNNQIQQTNPYLQAPRAEEKSPKNDYENKTESNNDKKKADDKKKQKVILTDNYIKTLENYMNNAEPKVRLMGAKEVLERFKEDDTRKNDAALTALLNKALQDPAATVRFMALTTLDLSYAAGNSETVEILKGIENRSDLQYGEDALLASKALLKMSGTRVDIPQNNQMEAA